MKSAKTLLGLALVVILAFPALAAPCRHKPLDGVYSTSTGALLGGRVSEAFCSGVGPGVPGNMQNAMSWSGSALGTQWTMSGMTIDAAGAVETGRFFTPTGSGWIDYITNYTGGQFWLSGAGPWGDGLGDFTGAITYYNVGVKVSYVAWQQVGVTANISFTGVFDDCNWCFIDYGMANSILIWRTGMASPMPAGYPPFLCGASSGELHDVCCVTFSIFCDITATEESTWGAIKDLYR